MILSQGILWGIFAVFILTMLLFDLFAHRKAHVISVKEALVWSLFWVLLALAFNAGIYFFEGKEKALSFFTGYLVERSLSMDNLFVFLLIFNYFKVPLPYQHNVLFWGIFGALIIRAVFIVAGVTLIHQFHWLIYIFGIFLVITGIKLCFEKDKEIHPENNPVLKILRRFLPVTSHYEEKKFFVRKNGTLWATPLLIALVVVETTDIIFALDSIPAILAITTDPFIVYSSNVFAILGLRALYFALAAIMGMFRYLHYGLAMILAFVGAKMLLADIIDINIGVTLGVVVFTLLGSILLSIGWARKHSPKR